MSTLTIDVQVSDELRAIIGRVANAPQEFVDWVKDEQLWQPADIGAICKDEDKVTAKIIEQLHDHASLRTRHKSAVVRIWWLCRTAMSKEENLATGKSFVSQDGPLEAEISEPCHAAWLSKCGSRILSNKLLIDTTLKSINSELLAKPRKLSVRLAENLRTQACISKMEASALVFRAGQIPTRQQDINDDVIDKYNLWVRIRAWLFSIAFLTLPVENFLSPAKAESYSEMFLELMHVRFDGSPAPLQHFITAYLQSAKVWVEAIRDGRTLEDALCAEATWRHLWSTYTGPNSPFKNNMAGPSKTNHGEDVKMDLQMELDKLRKQNKNFQSERDQAVHRAQQAEDGGGGKAKKRRVGTVTLRPAR